MTIEERLAFVLSGMVFALTLVLVYLLRHHETTSGIVGLIGAFVAVSVFESFRYADDDKDNHDDDKDKD